MTQDRSDELREWYAEGDEEELEYTAHGCRTAEIGCLDCKHIMIARAETELGPITQRYAVL